MKELFAFIKKPKDTQEGGELSDLEEDESTPQETLKHSELYERI